MRHEFSGHACLGPWLIELTLGPEMSAFQILNQDVLPITYSQEQLLRKMTIWCLFLGI
jgi:hypothetical protein